MKTFLVVCNHVKETVQANSPVEARDQLPCRHCRAFDLVAERWNYRDVRVYAEDQEIHAKRLPAKHTKSGQDDQLDWVGRP